MPQTPIERYRALLFAGKLQADTAQARAAGALESLYRALKTYRPPGRGLFGFSFGASAVAPRGLYIHGDVGRGKIGADGFVLRGRAAWREEASRIHFNAFMAETHSRINEWRQPLSKRAKSAARAAQIRA